MTRDVTARCRMPVESVALGDAGVVEGRDLAQDPGGGLHERHGEDRAGALAEPEPEVHERIQPQSLERDRGARFLRPVPRDEVADHGRLQACGGQGLTTAPPPQTLATICAVTS
jgi:hypothetical protein